LNTFLTAFVCSTYIDLREEREAVLNAIRRLQFQHDSMEFFGARANKPIETCLQEVRRSNILIVIVGHLYGSLVPELGISFSEAEYNEGYKLKKPCLVYMRGENVPILPKHIERDVDKLQLLDKWKKTLKERHTVATFQDSNDLPVQVAADLSRSVRELKENAQIREKPRREIDDSTTRLGLFVQKWALIEMELRSKAKQHLPKDKHKTGPLVAIVDALYTKGIDLRDIRKDIVVLTQIRNNIVPIGSGSEEILEDSIEKVERILKRLGEVA